MGTVHELMESSHVRRLSRSAIVENSTHQLNRLASTSWEDDLVYLDDVAVVQFEARSHLDRLRVFCRPVDDRVSEVSGQLTVN